MDKRFSNNYSNTGTDIINGLSFFFKLLPVKTVTLSSQKIQYQFNQFFMNLSTETTNN